MKKVYAAFDLSGELICTAPNMVILAKAMGVSICTIENRKRRAITKHSPISAEIYKFNVKMIDPPEVLVLTPLGVGDDFLAKDLRG